MTSFSLRQVKLRPGEEHRESLEIELPAFDGKGYPVHQRGISPVDGLHFLGLPWLYTWGSGRFSGVAADASYLANRIEVRLGKAPSTSTTALNELALGS